MSGRPTDRAERFQVLTESAVSSADFTELAAHVEANA